MSKYLYGASIQGIQSFIFQTNKLREIVGASELVEEVCKETFFKVSGLDKSFDGLIQNAAGNIKVVFKEDEVDNLDKLVLGFPKSVMEKAPGITMSQAVVEFKEGQNFKDAIDEIEKRLKTQRSIISKPMDVGFMGLAKDRKAGGIGIFLNESEGYLKEEKDEILSSSTKAKRAAAKSKTHTKLFEKTSSIQNIKEEALTEITELSTNFVNNWIAVIHVDGNGVGKLIQELSAKLEGKGYDENRKAFGDFSKNLELSTERAAWAAFEEVFTEDKTGDRINKNKDNKFPFRPIICGGDDLTVIIRADLALEYTKKFIESFQAHTKSNLFFLKRDHEIDTFSKGLTACAGITYIKNSYPLHYALNLSETLCKEAKKLVKDKAKAEGKQLPESSIAFYKVQESFIDDLPELKKRTLTAQGKLHYYGGPYLLDGLEDKLLKPLDRLKKESENKKEKSKAVGKIRRIVSETFDDFSTAIFSLERMEEINKEFYKNLNLAQFKEEIEKAKDNGEGKSILFDIMSLHSFNYGKNGGN